MRKLTSVLLIMIIVLCMGTTVFADEPPTTNLTINNSDGRTYNGYQLLTLTTSLKCNQGEGHTHSTACYNYAYTVNTKYEDILQAQAGENNDIIAYLNGLSSDTADGYGTLRPVADSIYREILKAGIEADAEELQGTGNINQGYWLFADITDLDEENNANSLVMVNTKGQDTLTITPKTALPRFEKKVKDIDDSTDSDISDNDWEDSADHDRVGVVPFKLTATLPENLANYTTYMIEFHDTLSEGLRLDTDSIQVYMYASMAEAEAATIPNDDEHKVEGFNTVLDGSHNFTVTCSDVLEIEDVDKDTVFVVYYEATLTEDAEMGDGGNSNTAYLEFSNNPYDSEQTGKITDAVKVFTYQLNINKVDAEDAPLPDAGFTLYKYNAVTREYVSLGTGTIDATGTIFTWTHLDDGEYKLVESTVPAGYNKMDDLEFTISADHDTELNSLSGGALGTGVIDTGIIEKSVTNYTGTVLPSTGAKGTMMLIGGGSVFIVLAAVFMITRKKMSIYED